jgi:hypothetical protein
LTAATPINVHTQTRSEASGNNQGPTATGRYVNRCTIETLNQSHLRDDRRLTTSALTNCMNSRPIGSAAKMPT